MKWLAALVALPVLASAEVTIEHADYHGWRDCVRMTNGTVDLVFVPQIGRIMRYGYVNGPNMLWENPALFGKVERTANGVWVNYGGDKLWPAPQSAWGWPPDPDLDDGPCTVLLEGKHVLVNGMDSEKTGLRFRRIVEMDPEGTGVTLINMLVNGSEQTVNASVWEIAQTDDPDEAWLPAQKTADLPKGWAVFGGGEPDPAYAKEKDGVVHIRRKETQGVKYGAASGAGYVAAVKGDTTFRIATPLLSGAKYPDDGKAQEIWTNGDPLKYVELELLGPLVAIPPEGHTGLTVKWSLEKPAH